MNTRNRKSMVFTNSKKPEFQQGPNIHETKPIHVGENERNKKKYCEDSSNEFKRSQYKNHNLHIHQSVSEGTHKNNYACERTEIGHSSDNGTQKQSSDLRQNGIAVNVTDLPRKYSGRARFMKNLHSEIKPGIPSNSFLSSSVGDKEIRSSNIEYPSTIEEFDDQNIPVKTEITASCSERRNLSCNSISVSEDKSRNERNYCKNKHNNSIEHHVDTTGTKSVFKEENNVRRSRRSSKNKDKKSRNEQSKKTDRRSNGNASESNNSNGPRKLTKIEEIENYNAPVNNFTPVENSEKWDENSWDVSNSTEASQYVSEKSQHVQVQEISVSTTVISPRSSNLNADASPFQPYKPTWSYQCHTEEGVDISTLPQRLQHTLISNSHWYVRNDVSSYNLHVSKDLNNSSQNNVENTDYQQREIGYKNTEEETVSINETFNDTLSMQGPEYEPFDSEICELNYSSSINDNIWDSSDQSQNLGETSSEFERSKKPIKKTKRWDSPIRSRGDKIVTENRNSYNIDRDQCRRTSQESTKCGERRSLDSSYEKKKRYSRRSIEVFRREDFQNDEEEFNFNPFQDVDEREYINLIEIRKDLFDVSEDYSLAHCVAADFCMGSGIATEFRDRFGSIEELKYQKSSPGGLALLKRNGRFVYYLVTKEWSRGKPTYRSLWSSLKCLRQHISENGVEKLAIPRIACGLDGLEWPIVKGMLRYLFFTSKFRKNLNHFELLVCSHNPETTRNRTTESDKSIETAGDSDSSSWTTFNSSHQSWLSTQNFRIKDDPECEHFDPYTQSRWNYDKVKEIERDLFTVDETYSLAHCVAQDFGMGSGIAIEFRRRFNCVADLMNQRRTPGEIAILDKTDGRFIYYLVTKELSCNKPTYKSLWMCLKKLREHVSVNKVKKLAMPKIGCGLDRLDWNIVKPMMEYLFNKSAHKDNLETFEEILVCDFQQDEFSSPRQPLKSCKVLFEKYHINQIEKKSIILYFASRDMELMEKEHMIELNEKHRFLRKYSNTLTLGEVVRHESYTKKLIFYGCLVKRRKDDEFDYVSFKKCLKQIRKDNQTFAFKYVSIQKLKDDILTEQILNLMKYTLRGVNILCCSGAKNTDIRSY